MAPPWGGQRKLPVEREQRVPIRALLEQNKRKMRGEQRRPGGVRVYEPVCVCTLTPRARRRRQTGGTGKAVGTGGGGGGGSEASGVSTNGVLRKQAVHPSARSRLVHGEGLAARGPDHLTPSPPLRTGQRLLRSSNSRNVLILCNQDILPTTNQSPEGSRPSQCLLSFGLVWFGFFIWFCLLLAFCF
jgi:hypothetical protein